MKGSHPLLEIVAQLDGLEVDEGARQAFRGLVLTVGMQHGVRGIDRIEQLAYARRLLDLHVSRPTIRERLTALYPVSRRQAYRLIEEALQLCQNRPGIGTDQNDNSYNDVS